MTTNTLFVIAAIGTVWLTLIIIGVLSWTHMSRKRPASGRSKQQYKQKTSKADSAVDETQFGSGLTVRIWKGATGGVFKAGLTLLRVTTQGFRHTLCVEQCLDIPGSLLVFCDVLEKQSWLLDEDRELLPLLRAAMLAAEEVVLESKQESRQVIKGRASLNGNATP